MMRTVAIVMLPACLMLSAAVAADECTQGDCVNGKGTVVYATGHTYTGGFKNGERSGQGILIYPDGKKQEGTFKGGEYVGN